MLNNKGWNKSIYKKTKLKKAEEARDVYLYAAHLYRIGKQMVKREFRDMDKRSRNLIKKIKINKFKDRIFFIQFRDI